MALARHAFKKEWAFCLFLEITVWIKASLKYFYFFILALNWAKKALFALI